MSGRLFLILVGGLVLAHALSFGLVVYQQNQTSRNAMLYALGMDVANAVAILERVPAAERPAWLDRLERRNYRFVLGPVPAGAPLDMPLADAALDAIRATLDAGYRVDVTTGPDPRARRLDVHLRLRDGTPLTIVLTPAPMPLAPGLVPAMLVQLAVLAGCLGVAVRVATRPLAELAAAADGIMPQASSSSATSPLPEDGPTEVARAARAFNAMQRRIADFLAERMRILAAVSHDLQTPITRMRLRADLLDDPVQRDRMHGDLLAMQALVEEGIAYARDAGGLSEAPRRVDLDALLASLAFDYADAGQAVRIAGRLGVEIDTRPNALRRIVANLVDNALKFGGEAEIALRRDAGQAVIAVLDRGPGIDPSERQAVLQPFYRIEGSRNRDSGGTGLGLAIVDQLTRALGGTLELAGREGGGLEARVALPLPGG